MNSLMSRRVIDCSSSKRNSASALASSVFPTPLGPRKRNDPMGLPGSRRPDAPAPHRARHGAHGLVLPDHALGEARLHLEQLLALGLEHLADRDAGPVAEDDGDVLLGHDVDDALAAALAAHRGLSRPRAGASRRAAARARARPAARSRASRAPPRAAARAAPPRPGARRTPPPPRGASRACARISLTVGLELARLLLEPLARLHAHRVRRRPRATRAAP